MGSSKLVLGILAAVLVVGGIVAVRTLTGPDAGDKSAEVVTEQDETEESSTASGSSSRPQTRVSSAGSSSRSSRPTPSGRTFERGEGAAAIDVTPATTTTAQAAAAAAAAVATPDTESTGTSIEDQKAIADLAAQFLQTTDPEERIDIADELGLIDDPQAIAKLVELLRQENDPTVQAALLEAMQGLDALEMTGPEVLQAVKDIYARTTDPDVRIAAHDLLSDVATADAAAYMRQVHSSAADPLEKLNAAEAMMRMYATDPDLITQQEATALSDELKESYQNGPDAAYRSQAIMALAVDGRNNLPFFQQALQTEQDPQLRTLLERLVRIYSQSPPQAPPPGTVVTPAPQP